MEIIDSQVHLNLLVPQTLPLELDDVLKLCVMTMDAVGVDVVLISERRMVDAEILPNGAVRMRYPFSERAVQLYPHRFGLQYRADYRDPDMDRVVGEMKASPGVVCLRIVPSDGANLTALANGEYRALFAAAESHQLPICAAVHGVTQLLVPYVREFPELQFVIDHTGVPSEPPPGARDTSRYEASLEGRVARFEPVLEMAKYPNVALKWSHAVARLSGEPYPHRDVIGHLRRAIDAFGIERLLWAGDYTSSESPWGQALYYLLDSERLTEVEKEWLLGKTVRKLFQWVQAPALAGAETHRVAH